MEEKEFRAKRITIYGEDKGLLNLDSKQLFFKSNKAGIIIPIEEIEDVKFTTNKRNYRIQNVHDGTIGCNGA